MTTLEPDSRRTVAIEHVDGVDETDLLGPVGHHQRMRARPATEEADALQEVAGRHPGRREHEVLARRQVLGPIDAVFVAVAHPCATLAFVVAAIAEPCLDLATQAT